MHSLRISLTIAWIINFLNVETIESFSYPFRRFQFAPNNVCFAPNIFYAEETVSVEDCSGRSIETSTMLNFTMRNVPGESSSCMFLAVALTTSASMGLGGSNDLLRVYQKGIRNVVADVLSCPHGNLYIEDNRIVPASGLLSSAARAEGLTPEEYIHRMRNFQLEGGGPELTVLSNVLRRPISIYELDEKPPENKNQGDTLPQLLPDRYRIKRVGVFGDCFTDPCLAIPDSAVLSGLQPGAYSWHLNILVVDVGPGEKHACALFPQELEKC